MPRSSNQILTVAQMQVAELEIGASVDQLMQIAVRGAADFVWRVAAHRKVTVLEGAGNKGGGGEVNDEASREQGGDVKLVAGAEAKTDAAKNARGLYRGEVLGADADPDGDVLVDCLFGSGLTRPLGGDQLDLFLRLCASHKQRIAIDVPSGVHSDSGELLNQGLPQFDLTIALGAWKFAHHLMPASAAMGHMRLVDIGCNAVAGAAQAISRPSVVAPGAAAPK